MRNISVAPARRRQIDRLDADIEGRARARAPTRRRAGHAGQDPSVGRRGDDAPAVLDDEHVRSRRLEHESVEIAQQRLTVRARGQCGEQAPVGPFVSDRCRRARSSRDSGTGALRLGAVGDLDPGLDSAAAGGRRPASGRGRCPQAAAEQLRFEAARAARRRRASTTLPREPFEVALKRDGMSSANEQRLEHAGRRIGPRDWAADTGAAVLVPGSSAAGPSRVQRGSDRGRAAAWPWSRTRRPRRPDRSRRRCRRRRRATRARRGTRTSGSRRSARVRRPGWRTRWPRCRRHGSVLSSSAITFIAAILGAPVTDPGGNAARTSSPSPTPSRSVPLTSETRCQTPVCGRASRERVDADRPGQADPAEVVAHEVDDHHVLGAVLLRGQQPSALGGRPADRAAAGACP